MKEGNGHFGDCKRLLGLQASLHCHDISVRANHTTYCLSADDNDPSAALYPS